MHDTELDLFIQASQAAHIKDADDATTIVDQWIISIPADSRCNRLKQALRSLETRQSSDLRLIGAMKRALRKLQNIQYLESRFPKGDFIPSSLRPRTFSEHLIQEFVGLVKDCDKNSIELSQLWVPPNKGGLLTVAMKERAPSNNRSYLTLGAVKTARKRIAQNPLLREDQIQDLLPEEVEPEVGRGLRPPLSEYSGGEESHDDSLDGFESGDREPKQDEPLMPATTLHFNADKGFIDSREEETGVLLSPPLTMSTTDGSMDSKKRSLSLIEEGDFMTIDSGSTQYVEGGNVTMRRARKDPGSESLYSRGQDEDKPSSRPAKRVRHEQGALTTIEEVSWSSNLDNESKLSSTLSSVLRPCLTDASQASCLSISGHGKGASQVSPLEVDEEAYESAAGIECFENLQSALLTLRDQCKLNDLAVNVILSRYIVDGVGICLSNDLDRGHSTAPKGKQLELRNCERIFIPFHDPEMKHWSLYVYNAVVPALYHYDSASINSTTSDNAVRTYLVWLLGQDAVVPLVTRHQVSKHLALLVICY